MDYIVMKNRVVWILCLKMKSVPTSGSHIGEPMLTILVCRNPFLVIWNPLANFPRQVHPGHGGVRSQPFSSNKTSTGSFIADLVASWGNH